MTALLGLTRPEDRGVVQSFMDWLAEDDPDLAGEVRAVLDIRDPKDPRLAGALPHLKDVERRLKGAAALYEAELHLRGRL